MKHEIVIIGRGGQGILLLGKILGEAVTDSGLYVVATEAYGAETRGTESRVELIVSDNPDMLDFVKVRRPDVGVILYPYGVQRYLESMHDNATLIIDSINVPQLPLIKPGWFIHSKPFTRFAEKVGSPRVVNMVVLGYLIKVMKLVEPSVVVKAIENNVKREWVELNIKAFKTGLELVD